MFVNFDENQKKRVMNIQPMKLFRSKLEHPVYKVLLGYNTGKGNYKESEKYMLLNNRYEKEYVDMLADMSARDYELEHNKSVKNIEVLSVDFIGDAVLQIG